MAEFVAISLGWGVQSFTLAAMSALGELPPVDVAIHADTTWERSATYAFAARWMPWLAEHDVRVVTVDDKKAARRVADDSNQVVMIPAFWQDYEAGINGELKRVCTQRWKIAPIRRWLQANRSGQPVTQWIGITKDEWTRAKDSDVKYITHRFPLLKLDMTRGDCISWLQRHGLEVPGKSSCTFCPFHKPQAWQEMKREGRSDWQQAVKIDAVIRNKRTQPIFVHSARKPLSEAVDIPEDHGYVQLDMLDMCDSGACFL